MCSSGCQRLVSNILLHHSPGCSSRLGLSLDPELADLSSSKRQLALGTPLSTSWALRLQVGYHAHVTFLCTLDIWTPVCKLTQQTPYPLVHLARSLLSVLTAQRSYLPLPLNRWWCGNSLSIYPTFVTFYNDPFHHLHDGSWHQCLITKMVPIFNQSIQGSRNLVGLPIATLTGPVPGLWQEN